MTRLDDMTTADIASAVDAGTFHPNLYCRIMFGTRPYAFAAFAGQYLLYMGADLLWILATAICVLGMEHLTNRYTLKSYSTSQIVDHWLKRAEIVGARPRRRNLVVPCAFFAAALVIFFAGASLVFCHAVFLAALVSALIYAKATDRIAASTTPIDEIGRAIDPEDQIFIYRCWSYLALIFLLMFPLVLHIAGGVPALNRKEQVLVLLAVLWPLLGCVHGERIRFLVVRTELERLRDAFGGEAQPT